MPYFFQFIIAAKSEKFLLLTANFFAFKKHTQNLES